MKKKISILMVMAIVMQMFVVMNVSAATEKAYSFTLLGSIDTADSQDRNSTPRVDTDGKPNRAFGVGAYKSTAEKKYIYIHALDGLFTYDVTDPTKPTKVGTPIMTMKVGGNNQATVLGNKLYVTQNGAATAVYDINDATGELTNGTTISVGDKANRAYVAGDRLFIQTSADNGKIIVCDKNGTADEFSLEDGSGDVISTIGAEKINENTYRVFGAFYSNNGNVKLTVKDYKPNAETKIVDVLQVYQSDIGPSRDNFGKAEFISDTKVVFYKGEGANGNKIYTVDFTDVNNVKISSASTEANDANPYHAQKYVDDEVIFWGTKAGAWDFSADTPVNICSTNVVNSRATDYSVLDNITYLACDGSVKMVQVDRATVEETPVTEPERNISLGNVVTTEVSEATKMYSTAVTMVGDNKMLYASGTDGSKNYVYAYNITTSGSASLVNKIETTGVTEAGMFVKDGYLIFGNGCNVNFAKIESTGALASTLHKTVAVTNGNNQVITLQLKDNLLFINSDNYSSKAVVAYDVSNISDAASIKELAAIETARSRQIEVEKLSNIRYRVYIVQAGIGTMTLKIKDVKYVFGSMSVTDVFDGTPTTTDDLGWVSGNNGYVHKVADNKLLVTQGESNKYVVDVTNPAAPVVLEKIEEVKNTTAPNIVKIDRNNTFELAKNSAASKLVNYSGAVNSATSVETMSGYGVCLFEDTVYSVGGNKIYQVTVFDNTVIETEGFTVVDSENAEVTTTATNEFTVKAKMNNTESNTKPVTIYVALYDKDSDVLTGVKMYKKTLDSGFNTVEQSVKLTDIDADYNSTKTYAKVMVWDNNLKPWFDFIRLNNN